MNINLKYNTIMVNLKKLKKKWVESQQKPKKEINKPPEKVEKIKHIKEVITQNPNPDFIFDADWDFWFGEYDKEQKKKRKAMERQEKTKKIIALMNLAKKVIGESNHETKGRIVDKIREIYNINLHRATINFVKMLDFNIISPTRSGTYYLTWSDAGNKLENFNLNS